MAFEDVKKYFESMDKADRIMVFDKSSGTVEAAADAIGCKPCEIAKTMSVLVNERPVLIVTAGDAKVDNRKYKDFFAQKMKLIPFEQVEALTGHIPGGVCPFAVNDDIKIYLDVSLKRFETVYPAAGDDHSAVMLSIKELEDWSGFVNWVDMCKDWERDTAS